AFSRLTLTGPAGSIPLGALASDTGDALRADIGVTLAPGEYTVQWQTASADGHPAGGEFTFVVIGTVDTAAMRRVGASASAGDRSPMSMSDSGAHIAPMNAHLGHTEYRVARWVEFVALLTVLGALGFRHGVLPPLAARGVPTSDAGERARR